MDRRVIVGPVREAEQADYRQRRAVGWVIPKEKARGGQYEQHYRTADGEFRSRRAFALCISGHHAEFRQVVDAGNQEESASDNSPDEERNVDDVLHVIALLALLNFALAAMLQSPRPASATQANLK